MCVYVHMQVYLATTTTDLKSTDNGESRTRLEARVEAAGSAAASHNPCQARLENEKAVGRLVGDFSFCASASLTTTHSEHPGSVMAWHGRPGPGWWERGQLESAGNYTVEYTPRRCRLLNTKNRSIIGGCGL